LLRVEAVAQDRPVFEANKESEVQYEAHKNHSAEVNDEGGIVDNETEGDTELQIVLDPLPPTNEPRGNAYCPLFLECQPTPETTLVDMLAEAPSTSDTASTGGSATFANKDKAGTMNTTKTIAAAKRKVKKDQRTPVEDAYTRDPCLRKLRPTDLDTEVVNNKLIFPGQRVSKGKTQVKKSDWAEIGSAKASAKAEVGTLMRIACKSPAAERTRMKASFMAFLQPFLHFACPRSLRVSA
ncbi:hypothetical protein BDK51DRAFT_27193, partial [Blyttiomyces helicus]